MYLLRAKDSNVTVVLYRHLKKQWYLFSNEGISVVEKATRSPKPFQKYLADPNTWYLVDTAMPLEVKAKTVLVLSPYVQQYKEFQKTNTRVLDFALKRFVMTIELVVRKTCELDLWSPHQFMSKNFEFFLLIII